MDDEDKNFIAINQQLIEINEKLTENEVKLDSILKQVELRDKLLIDITKELALSRIDIKQNIMEIYEKIIKNDKCFEN